MIKLIKKWLVILKLVNEMINKDNSKRYQVIGSKVVKILEILEWTFWSNDKMEIKFVWNKTGVNLADSNLEGFITQLPIQISDF